jgi:predicted methyltransferase
MDNTLRLPPTNMLIFYITFLVLAIQSVAQAVSDEHRSLAEIYRDAKKENGTLNVYSGGSSKLTLYYFPVDGNTTNSSTQLVEVHSLY